MKVATFGWELEYDVKGQCAQCLNTVQEGHMLACTQDRQAFPNASNCPVFRHIKETDE